MFGALKPFKTESHMKNTQPKIVFFTALLSLSAFNPILANSLISTKLSSEKCVLTKATQSPSNPYPVMAGLTAINIYNEKSIMGFPNPSDIKKPQNTLITFNFKDNRKEAMGDQLFPTVQNLHD